MATLVTQDFEREIAEKTVNGGVIQYDEFIFAMIPNLSEDNLAQHLTIPEKGLIKHRQAVSKAGVINENAVVYSVTLGTEIGDFDFNWIGLINKRTNKLAVAVQADTIKKTRNKNNVQGNSLTRNVLLEFAGAKQLTQINVRADTWQIDFTVRLHGIDEKIRLTNRDLYGRAVFFDDAFLVKRGAGNNYTIDAGHAYIEGVRAEIKQAQTIQAASLPCSIYLDVVHHCTVTGAYETEIKFLKQSKSDYLDTANKQHYVQIIADIDRSGAVTDRRLLSPWFGITPKDLDDTTTSTRDKTGHTHRLPLASLIKKGLVQLYSGIDSNSEELAATPKAIKTLKGFIDSIMRSLNNYIPNSKKSSAVDSNSEDTIGTSKAVKIAYDRAVEAEKKGMPVGAVVAFSKEIENVFGYLKCTGATFSELTYPDLYRALGNKNKTPNLQRSDVGMTAFFSVDDIPEGWIYFDDVKTQVTQSTYPELYKHLVKKYGSISQVPYVEDRFIRNTGNGLSVGQKQSDAIRNITGRFGPLDNSISSGLKGMLDGPFYLINEERHFGLNADWNGNNPLVGFDISRVVPTADENRPKSIVMKFCIKAVNTFDDVVFWIKAYGVVENTGALNAGNLARDIQQVSVKTQQLEESFNKNKEQTSLKIQAIERQLNENNQGSVVWSGNVTQHSTNIIELSESILNKTLIFYLQVSQSHSLSQNFNVHTASLFIDKSILNATGRKYCHTGLYIGGWKNCQIEVIDGNRIRVIDISGMYLKKITVI
ncbi:phage tail-collar fiber domain-containing protein [Pasteurella multocida]|uniref:phage tail-collar fiber domain-containing protein n=1 Tax=Pasteurella multocida TaxID=747 RepID=UPI002BA55C8A|nr:phage tail protein [Pasteurella multocida]MEB3457128.1 phage tail protein [Pasteurella multocida]